MAGMPTSATANSDETCTAGDKFVARTGHMYWARWLASAAMAKLSEKNIHVGKAGLGMIILKARVIYAPSVVTGCRL